MISDLKKNSFEYYDIQQVISKPKNAYWANLDFFLKVVFFLRNVIELKREIKNACLVSVHRHKLSEFNFLLTICVNIYA